MNRNRNRKGERENVEKDREIDRRDRKQNRQ
jgi:hypothetical protein